MDIPIVKTTKVLKVEDIEEESLQVLSFTLKSGNVAEFIHFLAKAKEDIEYNVLQWLSGQKSLAGYLNKKETGESICFSNPILFGNFVGANASISDITAIRYIK